MSSCQWFRYSDQPPPLTVRVRVLWEGREFIAARARLPNGGEAWAEYRRGSDRPQPVHLAGAPDLWQPLKPDAWRLPLPEPVTLAEAGRLTTERTRFTLVDDAEAADLAREMEADRAAAQATGDTPAGDPIAWWRDATQIKYESAPDITLRMVEGRLMRAVACCGAKRAGGVRISPFLAEIGEAAAQALAEDEATISPNVIPRFQPLPADEDDFLTAMGWFAALYAPEQRPSRWQKLDGLARLNRSQRVILWRAKNIPLSFAEIGDEFNLSRERARQIFEDGIDGCWRLACGLPPRKGAPKPVDRIALVREANRRARAQG